MSSHVYLELKLGVWWGGYDPNTAAWVRVFLPPGARKMARYHIKLSESVVI